MLVRFRSFLSLTTASLLGIVTYLVIADTLATLGAFAQWIAVIAGAIVSYRISSLLSGEDHARKPRP